MGTVYHSQSLPRASVKTVWQSDPLNLSLGPSLGGESPRNPVKVVRPPLLPSASLPSAGVTGGSGGVGMSVSLKAVEEGWSIPPPQKSKYNLMFNTLDKKRSGLLTGQVARNELLKSHLDYNTLAKIWLVSGQHAFTLL